MTFEMWFTLAVLIIAIVLLITEWVRIDIAAVGVVIALIAGGILPLNQGLAGFSNSAVISIAALFVVGGAVFKTGLADLIARQLMTFAGGNEARLLAVLMVSVAGMSAFISSTGVVALMLPAVVSLAAQLKINTSRLLIPLAYSALLGGSLTLIGTPPNLILSDALREGGYSGFSFFSFTPIGLLLLGIGLVYMLTVGKWLLPDRTPPQRSQAATTPGELFDLYRLPDNLYRLRVLANSPLVGQTLAASRLGSEFHLTVISIERKNDRKNERQNKNGNGENGHGLMTRLPIGRSPSVISIRHPEFDTVLQANDVLLVQGEGDAMARAAGYWQLAVMAKKPIAEGDLITNEVGIAEVLLRPRSTLLGQSLADLRFGSKYHLTVLDIRPTGDEQIEDIKTRPLRLGDVLLVQGEWKDIFELKNLRRDFIVMGEREAEKVGAFSHYDKAPYAFVILVGMVIIIALNILELAPAAMLAGVLMVLAGCLTMDDAYESIDWKSLMLIAGILPMSTALVEVGLVAEFSTGFVDTFGNAGPTLILASMLLLTLMLTQLLSNTASALLLAPLALATAETLGVRPHSFMLGVALAASLAFVTPIASPVNTLVMSAGHYRFNDYVKSGLPLTVMLLIVLVLVLPILYPF